MINGTRHQNVGIGLIGAMVADTMRSEVSGKAEDTIYVAFLSNLEDPNHCAVTLSYSAGEQIEVTLEMSSDEAEILCRVLQQAPSQAFELIQKALPPGLKRFEGSHAHVKECTVRSRETKQLATSTSPLSIGVGAGQSTASEILSGLYDYQVTRGPRAPNVLGLTGNNDEWKHARGITNDTKARYVSSSRPDARGDSVFDLLFEDGTRASTIAETTRERAQQQRNLARLGGSDPADFLLVTVLRNPGDPDHSVCSLQVDPKDGNGPLQVSFIIPHVKAEDLAQAALVNPGDLYRKVSKAIQGLPSFNADLVAIDRGDLGRQYKPTEPVVSARLQPGSGGRSLFERLLSAWHAFWG
jgi:hypothetical protein